MLVTPQRKDGCRSKINNNIHNLKPNKKVSKPNSNHNRLGNSDFIIPNSNCLERLSNYGVWSFRMKNILQKEDAWNYVENETDHLLTTTKRKIKHKTFNVMHQPINERLNHTFH